MASIPRMSRAQRRQLVRDERRTGDPEVAVRFQIIAELGAGHSHREVAELAHVAPSTVGKRPDKYAELGVAGLFGQRKANGFAKVDEQFLDERRFVRSKTPDAYGWSRHTWTRELLCTEMARRDFEHVAVCTMGRAPCAIGARLGTAKPIVLCLGGEPACAAAQVGWVDLARVAQPPVSGCARRPRGARLGMDDPRVVSPGFEVIWTMRGETSWASGPNGTSIAGSFPTVAVSNDAGNRSTHSSNDACHRPLGGTLMRTRFSTTYYPVALLALLPLGCSHGPEDTGETVGTVRAALSTTTTYTLVGVDSGKCMDIEDGSTANGANVRIWSCNGAAAQQFKFVDAGGGYYELRNVNSNKCVEIAGAGTSTGDNVVQYDCWGGDNQLWALNESGGVVNLVNKGSGLATDVYDWGTSDGTNIVQWTNYNADNQRWTLSEAGSGGGGTNPIPDSITWTSSGILISPHNSAHASVKDPTIAYHGGKYHVYATVYNTQATWQMVYFNFTDWAQANNAPQYEINQVSGFSGYNCAPEVFFFPPHDKWYLIYQSQPPRFSTVDNIDEPWNLTYPQNMFTTTPSGMPSLPIDYYVICDDVNCHMFFTGDDGKLYRTQTSIGNFPHGWGSVEVELSYSTSVLFEGSSHYKIKDSDTYLTVIEGMGGNGRWFAAWTATNLAGPWTQWKVSESAPFAGYNNVSFPGGRWTNDISHGEMIKYQNDHHSILDPNNMQFLYQGRDPSSGGAYELLPYHIGLLTADNATGGPPGGVVGGEYCGDGSCNNGETCSTCAADCGTCAYCGDGSCNNGETCSTCAADCGACSGGTAIYLEAECADSSSGAYGSTSTSKSGYSGDGHIMSVGNTGATSYDGSSTDLATYDFSADAGSYDLYVRVDSDGDWGNDSMFYRVNGGSWVMVNGMAAVGSDWGWYNAGTVTLSASNALEIANREDGLGIDKIALVPAGSAAPTGTGGTANNCSASSSVLTNGGFESGTTGWTNWAGTLSTSSTNRSGSASGILTGRTATWQGPVQSLMGKVSGGQQYTARAYARVSSGSEPVSLVLQTDCGGTVNYTGVGSGTATSSSWVELSGTFTAPTCGDLQGLNLYVDGPAGGVDLMVDDAEVL